MCVCVRERERERERVKESVYVKDEEKEVSLKQLRETLREIKYDDRKTNRQRGEGREV